MDKRTEVEPGTLQKGGLREINWELEFLSSILTSEPICLAFTFFFFFPLGIPTEQEVNSHGRKRLRHFDKA